MNATSIIKEGAILEGSAAIRNSRFLFALWCFVSMVSVLDLPARFISDRLFVELRDLAYMTIIVSTVLWYRESRNPVPIIAVVLVMLAHCLIGFDCMGGDMTAILQVAFGVKLLFPFAIGICLAPVILDGRRPTLALLFSMWLISSIGIILDWAGVIDAVRPLDPTVAGVQLYGYSLQQSGDSTRFAGFARNWGSASIHVSTSALLLMLMLRRRWLKVLLAALSVFPLYLTTSKAISVAFAFTFILTFFRPAAIGVLLRVMIVTLLLLMIMAPIGLSGIYVKLGEQTTFSLWSIFDRVSNGWPGAWDLVFSKGAGLLGRGMGGAGSPQYIFDFVNYNPFDNVFLFMFGYFGIFSVFYLGYYLYLVMKASPDSHNTVKAYILSVFCLVEGMTNSSIEDTVQGSVFGAAVGMLFLVAQRQSAEQPQLGFQVSRHI